MVAQWIKCWWTELTVPSLIPGNGNLFKPERASFAHGLSLSPYHCPDMTEIVEKDIKLQVIDLFKMSDLFAQVPNSGMVYKLSSRLTISGDTNLHVL